LAHRFIQYGGRLFISTIILAELYAWVHLRPNLVTLLDRLKQTLLADVTVMDYDSEAAQEFGRIQGHLQKAGVRAHPVDVMIASTALVKNLTLVTHNTKDFQNIPGLRLDDWLVP
jgi:predicted nucleic acid-binding protein